MAQQQTAVVQAEYYSFLSIEQDTSSSNLIITNAVALVAGSSFSVALARVAASAFASTNLCSESIFFGLDIYRPCNKSMCLTINAFSLKLGILSKKII
ncbi:hypothetical protein [Pseudoalteromonas sp. MMG024]|uniref:hypothetical protein n=1 Tax=Pseudoalteromonas sp. MMG024 TaxID=2909980 RepID=UPI001F3FF13F|nr:hypothetical protein [Pseudoalteromonas sp. MMG024]MCF6459098.1 hypothetical protein [Pseudoalteromonas sp. MMG024]